MKNINTDITQFRFSHKNCQSIEAFFECLAPESASYSIDYKAVGLDIEIDYKASKKIVFVFNGAIDREKIITPPAFTLRRISENSEATCVFFSDPSFYLSPTITLGWYAGNHAINAQRVISQIIKAIIEKFGAEEIIFFGGSGGGFASLFYSHDIRNSLAVVWNPQTIITNYYKKHVEAYCNVAFSCKPEELKNFIIQNIAYMYGRRRNKNRIVYIQNISDAHVQKHLKPFLKNKEISFPDKIFSDWVSDDMYLYLTDWSHGHSPPPKNVLLYLLRNLTKTDQILDAAYIKHIMSEAEAVNNSGRT